MKKVLVFGTFDVFHQGHEYFLKQARDHGDALIVVVSRDVTVKDLKKKLPLNNESFRRELVASLSYVDDALLGFSDDKYRIIAMLRPDIICLGYDQRAFTDGLEQKLKELGLEAKIIRIGAYNPEVYKSSYLKKRI